MAIKNNKINKLNAMRLRKTNFPAHHFCYTTVKKSSRPLSTAIDLWIFNNLTGRYYLGTTLSIHDNAICYVINIGFEQEKELSFFTLACPYVN